jgi:creatinine amidohydrolase/Fe(II)-dependent formamide hydrolase-like protein
MGLLRKHVPALQEAHPEVLFLWGTEMEICPGLSLPGDHAAREESSYGLALFPDKVDLDALRPGRGKSEAWPGGQAPPPETWHPNVCFDPTDPLFAQMGEDARTGSAARGEQAIQSLVDGLVVQIDAHLST